MEYHVTLKRSVKFLCPRDNEVWPDAFLVLRSILVSLGLEVCLMKDSIEKHCYLEFRLRWALVVYLNLVSILHPAPKDLPPNESARLLVHASSLDQYSGRVHMLLVVYELNFGITQMPLKMFVLFIVTANGTCYWFSIYIMIEFGFLRKCVWNK